ncbi:MAG: DUF992 domain-containing protein [Hyphomicrobium sp.]
MRWAIAAVLCLGAMPASAAMTTDVGVLTCTLAEHGQKGTEPESQTRDMLCSFKPKGAGPEESYTGEVKKVGSQTELTGKLVLIWAVMGPSDRQLKPAILEQTYVGEVADDTSGKSKTPKLLVGESDKAYGLQPITNELHEADASQSVTVVQLRIRSTPG